MSRWLITFDLNTTELQVFIENNKENLGFATVSNCYNIISKKLSQYGFKRIQGSVYETDDTGSRGTQADGGQAIRELVRETGWFIPPYVTGIRFIPILLDDQGMHIIEDEARKCESDRKLLIERLLKLGLSREQIVEFLRGEFPEQLQNPTLLQSIRTIPSSKKEDETE
ncbi:MAG: hypothetical protein J6V89_05440 [Acetobacter sp.]|nr:hypothetical protein [Acetobacter sp.]